MTHTKYSHLLAERPRTPICASTWTPTTASWTSTPSCSPTTPTPSSTGIRFTAGDRVALLASYVRALEPYRDVFLTGPDMGTSAADFLDAGEDPVPLWARSHERLGMDDLATGHGVKAAAEAALAHLGRTLEDAAVAVQGFGKVGAGTARACARAGARVVGVSTVDGLLADPNGLEVEELLALRERHGDRLVAHGSRPVRSRDALFELDCDVLVPGARPDSIPVPVAERLDCSVVAPAANIPYGAGAVEVLHRRGILASRISFRTRARPTLDDIVDQDAEPQAALAAIEADVRDAVARALATADTLAITPAAAALPEARPYLAQATGAPREALDELLGA